MNKDTYFNFPICLIDGMFEDKLKVLNNIFDYTIYAKAVSLEHGSMKDKVNETLKYFGVTANATRVLDNGKKLFNSTPKKSPKASIKKDLYFDYYQHEKTEFEIVVLCGFLAIRSILLFKPYCKVTDDYMLVRMAGRATVKEIENLPEPLKKYINRYHLDKIKKELRNWKLKLYGKHTRGFYVSFEMELKDLIFEVEKKRKKYIEKNYQNTEAEARKEVLRKLYEPTAKITDIIKYNMELIKAKADGDYNLGGLNPESLEAMKYIVAKKLMPEYELTLSPDFKNLIKRTAQQCQQ
ncbi:MAG: hypothetical protein M3R36_19325 [Bacteroidota bacterium]|nr:hypothetical protein [Bacteroidota bacterium]